MATRVGVQLGSVYIRAINIPSSAKDAMFGVEYPANDVQIGRTDFTKSDIVQQDIQNVGRLAPVVRSRISTSFALISVSSAAQRSPCCLSMIRYSASWIIGPFSAIAAKGAVAARSAAIVLDFKLYVIMVSPNSG